MTTLVKLDTRPRPSADQALLMITTIAVVGIVTLSLLGSAGWTVIVGGTYDRQLSVLLRTTALLCAGIWAFRNADSLWGRGKPLLRVVSALISICVVSAWIVFGTITMWEGVFSLARTHVLLDVPRSSTQYVVLETSGLGDAQLTLYTGSALLYRATTTKLPFGRDLFNPFRDGDYQVKKVGSETLLSYPTTQGGPYDTRVVLPRH
jgi:hypothetical protein